MNAGAHQEFHPAAWIFDRSACSICLEARRCSASNQREDPGRLFASPATSSLAETFLTPRLAAMPAATFDARSRSHKRNAALPASSGIVRLFFGEWISPSLGQHLNQDGLHDAVHTRNRGAPFRYRSCYSRPSTALACGASPSCRNGFEIAIEPKRAPSAMSSEKIVVQPTSAAEASSTLSQ